MIILGGMRTGALTPTEAAVVAVACGLLLGLVVYRSLAWREVWDLRAEATGSSAVILCMVGLAALFGWAVDAVGVFNQFAKRLAQAGSREVPVLFAITLALRLAGTALGATAMYFVFLPLLFTLGQTCGGTLCGGRHRRHHPQRRDRAVHDAHRGQPHGHRPPRRYRDGIDARRLPAARCGDDRGAARAHVRTRPRPLLPRALGYL